MTSIYTANHSREVPIFIESHFIVGLLSSIRELNVQISQFTNGTADIVNYSTHCCFTDTTQITSLTMKGS
ncbi:unnamed protein product [Arctogadus glacialis]